MPIILENSPCTGSETSLVDCPGITWGNVGTECTHDDDAGVLCTDGTVCVLTGLLLS